MSHDLEFAIKQDILNNPVVREIDLAQKREFLRLIAGAAAVAAMLIIALAPRFQTVKGGYAIEKLRNDVETEREYNRRLKLEYETETRPEVVEERAHRLGLVAPTEADTIIVERLPPSPAADRAIVAANR
jgi:cell division protein FtsL